MATDRTTARLAPISGGAGTELLESAGMESAHDGRDAHRHHSSPALPTSLPELADRVCSDGTFASRLTVDPRLMGALVSALLDNDEHVREMFVDAETLTAYLSAVLEKWRRRPPGMSRSPRRRVA